MNADDVIIMPVSTEKAIRMMDSENKLVFMVQKKATKQDIRNAVEDSFKVKVVNIKTEITNKGEKKAYVRLDPSSPALDVATNLGLM